MYFGQFELLHLDDIYLIFLQFTLFHRKKYEFFLLHSRDLIFGHGHDQCQDFVYVESYGYIGGQRSNMMTSSEIFYQF